MKTLVISTDLSPRPLDVKRIYWVENGEPTSKVVMITKPCRVGDMLVEHDDGADESQVREAIQAASFAGDWDFAYEIVQRYSMAACLRCGEDVSTRPTWRLSNLAKMMHKAGYEEFTASNWGEICGSCAAQMIKTGT